MAKVSSSISIKALVLMIMMMTMMAVVVVRGQTTTNPEIKDCAQTLYTLQTCLPFVGGKSNLPTPDCCTAMGKVVVDKPKCLCVLIKDHDDPAFSTFNINISYAVQLPTKCNNADADINKCPGLLGLDPNSPEAQIFKNLSNNANPPAPASPPSSTNSPNPTSSPSPTSPLAPTISPSSISPLTPTRSPSPISPLTPTSPSPSSPVSPPLQTQGSNSMRSHSRWWFEIVLACAIWTYFASSVTIL